MKVVHHASNPAPRSARYRIEYVVEDASEGYNPAHDLCRLILKAAVLITERLSSDAAQVKTRGWSHRKTFDLPELQGRVCIGIILSMCRIEPACCQLLSR